MQNFYHIFLIASIESLKIRFHSCLRMFFISLSQYDILLSKSSSVMIAYLIFLLKNVLARKSLNSILFISHIKKISTILFEFVINLDVSDSFNITSHNCFCSLKYDFIIKIPFSI